ncbi:HAD family hydrolase [Acidihalobacter ferrooxydans]|uniref:Phosphatase n=1 Tax=Acidihalobacter ferrooxydans TaxID=1765967 RepID=A0A1P8UEK2_9GAMM|nr:HAD family hydrolase [Acidihalobacter ferrooxydans]APZ42287.1 phosphatase [Acidihalobacter ferrooxydans]
MSLQALLFDVDGTLADTERDGHRVAFNQAFAEAGLDWEWSVALYGELLAVTGGKERIRFYLQRHRPDFARAAGDDLDTFIAGLHRSKTRHYLALLERGEIPLRPGVRRLLDEARVEGLRLAIVTTTTPENVDVLLRTTLGEDALGWFEVIAAGDVVPAKKPAPDIYQYALEAMGLGPEVCLALEDSENGLRSAAAAGCRTLVTVNEYTCQQDFSGAWLVVDQFGEAAAPATVLQGAALRGPCVDVAFLRAAFAAP